MLFHSWMIVRKGRQLYRIVAILGSFILLFFLFLLLPVVKFDQSVSTLLLDRNGALLSAGIADDEQWRFPPIERVPEKFVYAITCFEDRRFFSHPGVDIFSIVRAIREFAPTGLLQNRRCRAGASPAPTRY